MAPIDLRYARADYRTLRVTLAGEWKLRRGLPAPSASLDELERQPRPSQPSRFYPLAPGEVREIPAFARALVRFDVEVADGGAAAAEMAKAS